MARDLSPGMAHFWPGTKSGYSYPYTKLENRDWDDRSEASSIAPPKLSWRRRFFTVRVGGISLKILFSLVAGMAMLILLASAGVCAPRRGCSRPWHQAKYEKQCTDERQTCDMMKPQRTPEPPLLTKLPTLSPSSNSDPSDLRLRIILPADNGGPNLCKTVLSGYANGYPAPVIVNWGRDFNKDSSSFGLSHLGKIDGTLELLETLMSDTTPASERLTDDDIVIVMDAYDVWLQLPPSILISRFHAQNALANARLAASWTTAGNDTASPPPTQSIVISAQKKCWPKRSSGTPIRCDAMPPSTARPDLYGRMTDAGAPHDARPRHVNSGSVVGTAGAMLRMFRRVQDKVLEGHVADGNSDQGVFAEVLAEQELWRARARSGDDAERDAFEYGIGLDHVQDLMPPTVFAEQDGAFMRLDDEGALAAASFAHGVYPARLRGVPDDVGALEAPARYAGTGPGNATWADVPLYADYWTAKVPVAVHHNAHRGGLKARRLREWWALTWFFPYLRRVAEGVMPRGRVAPLATVQGGEGALVYWPAPSDAERPLPRIFDKDRMGRYGLEEAGWDVLCPAEGHEAWWEEVFQDGKGPLGS